MSLNAIDKKAIKDFLPFWGIDIKEATAEYTKAKEKVLGQFGVEDEKVTAERTLNIASVVIRPKSYNSGKGVPYKAIVLTTNNSRDMWAKQRDLQMKKYVALKAEGKERQAFADKVVSMDEKTGEVILLCPPNKANGMPSKKAGDPIDSPADAQIQSVLGITYIETKGKLSPVGFIGTLRGQFCVNHGFDPNAEYEFIGDGQVDGNTGLLILNINSTFKNVGDKYLSDGRAKLGIHGLVKKFLGSFVISQPQLASFGVDGKIPEALKDFVIVENALIPFYNPKPTKKHCYRIQLENRINIDNPPSADAQSTMGLAPESKVTLDFGEGTVGMVFGDAWIPKNDPKTIFNIGAIIPYPGDIVQIAPKETQAIPADEVDEDDDVPEDTKVDAPEPEVPKEEVPVAEEKPKEEVKEEVKEAAVEDDDVWN